MSAEKWRGCEGGNAKHKTRNALGERLFWLLSAHGEGTSRGVTVQGGEALQAGAGLGAEDGARSDHRGRWGVLHDAGAKVASGGERVQVVVVMRAQEVEGFVPEGEGIVGAVGEREGAGEGEAPLGVAEAFLGNAGGGVGAVGAIEGEVGAGVRGMGGPKGAQGGDRLVEQAGGEVARDFCEQWIGEWQQGEGQVGAFARQAI